MRHLALALLAATFLVSAPRLASAQAVQVGADIGMSRFMEGGPVGFGFNAYPGFRIGPLALEAQIGYHRANSTPADIAFAHFDTYVPMMLGARVFIPLGVVEPWVGGHIGYAHVGESRSDGFGLTRYHEGEFQPAYNLGFGLDVPVGGFVSVGAATWYHHAVDEFDPQKILNVSLGMAVYF